MYISDLFIAFWTAAVFAVLFLGLPRKIFCADGNLSVASSVVGRFARMMLLTVIGVIVLSQLRLLNWLTLLLLYATWPLCGWLRRHQWRPEHALRVSIRVTVLKAADVLEQGSIRGIIRSRAGRQLQERARQIAARVQRADFATVRVALALLALATALSFTLMLRFEQPLSELRLDHPDSYGALLVARQMISNNQPEINHASPFPALVTALSLVSSTDPMQVLRFLGPLLGCLMVLGVGLCIHKLTRNGAAALVALCSLGAYIFCLPALAPDSVTTTPTESHYQLLAAIGGSLNDSLVRQWAGGEPEIGALFLVLAFACLGDQRSGLRRGVIVDVACCLAMVALTAPTLLILAVAAAMGLAIRPSLSPAVMGGVWILLAVVTATPDHALPLDQSALLTLPVGLSLFCGFVFNAVSRLFCLTFGRHAEIALLLVVIVFSFVFLLPRRVECRHLEYDVAARKTLEIAELFPRNRWQIVAPVEQLAESFGVGWYGDLAQFVKRYAGRAAHPDFRFDVAGEHLFVFVEKRPFNTFATEPRDVPFMSLVDPTYRNYRSSAGRASLQFAAHELCESYQRTHADASIYYEDEVLSIYHFRGRE